MGRTGIKRREEISYIKRWKLITGPVGAGLRVCESDCNLKTSTGNEENENLKTARNVGIGFPLKGKKFFIWSVADQAGIGRVNILSKPSRWGK